VARGETGRCRKERDKLGVPLGLRPGARGVGNGLQGGQTYSHHPPGVPETSRVRRVLMLQGEARVQ